MFFILFWDWGWEVARSPFVCSKISTVRQSQRVLSVKKIHGQRRLLTRRFLGGHRRRQAHSAAPSLQLEHRPCSSFLKEIQSKGFMYVFPYSPGNVDAVSIIARALQIPMHGLKQFRQLDATREYSRIYWVWCNSPKPSRRKPPPDYDITPFAGWILTAW